MQPAHPRRNRPNGGRVGRVPVIKFDLKAFQVLGALGRNAGHELLWRDPFCFGFKHDWRAVGVISADKMHGVTCHTHGAHPDISLNVFHDVANVKRTIGVGQCGRDKDGA